MRIQENNREHYYQIRVIGQNDTGTAVVKSLHILAINYLQAVKLSRGVTHFEYQSFQEFILKYRYLKIALLQSYRNLEGWEISRCHVESCLRVFKMDNRFDENVSLLILTEAHRVIELYLKNKKKG